MNDELRDMAGLKTQADSNLIRKLEIAKSIYWAGSILALAITLTTLWVAGIQYNQSDLRKDVNSNRKDIDVMKPRVDEMWWMKEAGIGNADLKRAQQPRPSATP